MLKKSNKGLILDLTKLVTFQYTLPIVDFQDKIEFAIPLSPSFILFGLDTRLGWANEPLGVLNYFYACSTHLNIIHGHSCKIYLSVYGNLKLTAETLLTGFTSCLLKYWFPLYLVLGYVMLSALLNHSSHVENLDI